MQSFDTKDSNTLESFDRKIKSYDTFGTKESEVKQPANDFVESFDRKFEGFDTKDSEVELSHNRVAQNFDGKFESFGSKKTKVDGRSKPRTRKQIDAWGKSSKGKSMNSISVCNFSKI